MVWKRLPWTINVTSRSFVPNQWSNPNSEITAHVYTQDLHQSAHLGSMVHASHLLQNNLAVQKCSSWALGFYLTYAPAWFLLWLCSPGLISFHVWHTIPIWHTKPILSTCISSGIITGLWILRHLTAALTTLIALKIYLLVLRRQKYTGLWSFLQDSLQ